MNSAITFMSIIASLHLAHPGDALPHPTGFEAPPLLFWSVSIVAGLLPAVLLVDLLGPRGEGAARAAARRTQEPLIVDTDEPLIVGRPRAGRGGVQSHPQDGVPEPPAPDQSFPVPGKRMTIMSGRTSAEAGGPVETASAESGTGSEANGPETPGLHRSWLNPARLLVTVVGIGLGIVATERAREVQALATLVRSGNAAEVSRVTLAFAVMLLVGGSLAISAPRAAALLLILAGATALFLSYAPELANRLRWWDAAFVLQPWSSLQRWAGGCLVLAAIAWFSASYRPERRWLR